LVNRDSVLNPGEVRLWLIGGSGLLQPGDSTSARTLQIQLDSPGSQARLNFGVEAMTSDTARPVIPSVTQWPAPLLVASPIDASGRYTRDVFAVVFEDTTSGQTINAFLSQFHATVIGAMSGTENSANPVY
jgi:hypothetical protein